jgi:transglutaminase superfamily protein
MAYLPFLPSVLWWMVVVEVSIRALPLDRVSRMLGVPLNSSDELLPAGSQQMKLTGWQRGQLRTLEPVAAHWPFSDGPCLRQSLVAGRVLRGHDPVLRLGVNLQDGLQAHAWVEVDGYQLGQSNNFTVLTNVGSSHATGGTSEGTER